ncbi:MAG TPA: ABC transporter ATP-binding protein [Caulifigura sp.]|jgi:ABC-2 type transport system ATP-binding protein|nr:ABC transporter ATP-binding protein [Caulifigura sp.]
MASPVLVQVSGLRYSYGERVAVRGLSFEIREGEILGFLGPNGAGKSTAISCLAGVLGNYTGEMSFRGQPFRPATNLEDRRLFGVVPQDLAIYESLTARENLNFFATLSGLAGAARDSAVAAALELAGLTDRADDLASTYSGGMKRRLNLVIGNLHSPSLLMLDEPTVGVDPQSRNHIFETLLKLRESGRTLLYTTHYMEEVQRLCDRIAIMNDGQVVAVGSAAELAIAAGTPNANLEQVFLHLTGRSLRDE